MPTDPTIKTATIAQLRNEAWEAERNCRWADAARIYQTCLDRFVPNPASQLDAATVRGWTTAVRICRSMTAAAR